MEKLDRAHALALTGELPGWSYSSERGGTIARECVFGDFVQAFAFMTQVAMEAERRNHHPEWSNVYNRVQIVLTTHDASGLSMLDFELARRINQLCLSAHPGAVAEGAVHA